MASTSKTVAVASSSPSPPPLPNEPLPSTSDLPVDQPIDSLGDDDDDEDEDQEEDGSASASTSRQGSGDAKIGGESSSSAVAQIEKGNGAETAKDGAADQSQSQSQPWQAVWAPEQNAWYFWNSITGEVTWTNPLELSPSTDASASSSSAAPSVPFQPPLPAGPPPKSGVSEARFGLPASIDPELAYLLPTEQRLSAAAPGEGQHAMFNARTGRFTNASNSYAIDHLDEYNRAKRMNSHYFDQDAWERQMAAENAKRKRDQEAGVAPPKITKKDMERFKKKKQEQRMRSQAWLRD
ncbi:hypothetical protein BCR39DRAFT_511339 [Naematelia encephala]|uniref:WW domain-containing protein n=1 Tax=Naematelia encephala TaxID=71784 RepID=A0A1Y2BNB7_9TREE|nr:hypothetical protein BCR39DRAFT_511339 [Naematelia encephala]